MKKLLFSGAATALITPFDSNGEIDLLGLKELIDFQIRNGIKALVIAGTTGESSTLSFEEFSLLIAKANEFIQKRVPLIAGTGTNATASAIKRSLEAQKRGADGLLVVTPYYNKTTQSGLIQHYFAIADRVKIPLLLYNVPSRTGMSIQKETYQKLSTHPRIVGTKEAGSSSAILDIAHALPDFPIYSGNDDQILPALVLGGNGVISVVSNLFPKEIQNICTLFQMQCIDKAREEQFRFLPLIRVLFSEVNPIPIKCAMQLMGMPCGLPRAPLTPCSEELKEKIKDAINQI